MRPAGVIGSHARLRTWCREAWGFESLAGHHIKVPGRVSGRTAVWTNGSGSTVSMNKQWVLIRGIMSESFHWSDFLPQMKSCFPHDRIHTPDILGNGPLNQHLTPLSLHKNITALRDQVQSTSKKILFGFSLGGMLSLEWAYRHPEEVEALILINCSLRFSAFYKRITPYSLARILKSAMTKDLKEREKIILNLTTSGLPEERLSELVETWGLRGRQYPVKSINFFRQIVVASQISRKQPPPVPVLILSSRQDKVVHPDCSRKMAQYWNASTIYHPTAGHDLTLQDPQWVLDQVQRFLNSSVATIQPKVATNLSK